MHVRMNVTLSGSCAWKACFLFYARKAIIQAYSSLLQAHTNVSRVINQPRCHF